MTVPTPAPGSPGPEWTAAAVARRLGVAPGTLRSWSRRYGIGPVAHTPGRHRRYTDADLAELDTVRALVGQGMVLPAAAAIARSQRPDTITGTPAGVRVLTGTPAPPPPTRPAERKDPVVDLVIAAARLDPDAATAVVTASLTEHGVITTWDRLCRPAFSDLDAAVARDRGCTDAQLLLSWVITTCLHRLPAIASPPEGRPVLLACAAGEQHTLALETLSAALADRRVPAAMLGPSVPAAALLHATHRLRPASVVLWAHRSTTAKPAVLHQLLPCADAVIVAGPGWEQAAVPPAVLRADTLQVALALTTRPNNRPAEATPARSPATASGRRE